MKKSLIKVFLTLICTLCFSLNVFAASTPYVEGVGEDEYGLKTKYNSFKKTTVSEENTTVTLYGKSVCDGSKCTLTYSASNNSSYKDALAKAVTCSNGEKNITYQFTGSSNNDIKENNNDKLDGTAYWDEDYSVSCTTESSGSYVVNLSDDSSSSNSSSSSTTTTGESQGSTSDYSSSSTVSNEKTGVNTYFVVLGVVAIISYSFMICVKKFNLFKNI